MPRHERRVSLPSQYLRPAAVVARNFRLLTHRTQADAAEWYGVSARTWQRYESGDTAVPAPLLRRIANFRERTPVGRDNWMYLTP